MKPILPLLFVSMMALSACSSSGTDVSDDMPPPDDTTMEDTTNDTSADTDDGVEARVIEMTVDDWTFTPAAITAAKGEKVIVRLKGVEGIHSFAIAELGINTRIEPGQTVDVEIPTDTAGTFAYLCRVPCGPGHKDMKGSLVIS